MASKNYTILTTERLIVDHQTGEITSVDSTKVWTTKISAENFFMTFIDHIGPLYQLKSDALKNLLNWLNSRAEFNTGKVLLPSGLRKECCEELNISSNTLTNYLKKLKDHRLISGADGIYLINPEIFWKGDTKSRAELMSKEEIKITFEIK